MKMCLAFVLFINLFSAKAQIQGTINYKCVINDKVMGSTVNYIIYFNNSKSIELGINANIKSGKIDENTEMIVTDDRPLFIFKDFKSKKIFLADYLGAKTSLISDTLSDFKWIITKEKSKFLNFNCIKALSTFRGRNYIAWFTNDIPIQNGPWKFCGLPGLIVKINDDKMIFNYELSGINLNARFKDDIIAIPKDYAKDRPISQKDYILRHKRKIFNNTKMAKVVHFGKDGSYGTVAEILPEKQEKF